MTKRLRSLLLVPFLAVAGRAEEPWSASASQPAWDETPRPESSLAPRSTGTIVARGWLAFYQQWLSVLSQSHCRMLPSCSAFSIQCIDKHGPLIGVVMTADRLLHEGDEQLLNRVVKKAGLSYCPDPVSNNDFWWRPRD